ncbi:YdcF family protein [Propionispora hippei]|uniref:Uncharacterized SAM-binding protein YcdF, DUF218 family n=1 Tax=Propionispora hippei DSM 15287 TaxID=1123003 RepID=A0A1M6K108_9FIRM|nr:YdcF family protein [Propionispora hippei]SHJ52673.1 Uncharacterized SAM-binding protein YcdF, DUF218 family [Propionispora hippei DSM 15287]
MFIYIYKFLVSFIMPPGILILAMLAITIYLAKKREQAAKWLGLLTLFFYFLSTLFVGNLLLKTLEIRFVPPENPTGDVIVMLGGGATFGTPDINGTGQLSGNAANRLLTAARLQKGLGIPVILSGGQVFDDSGREAVIGKRILTGIGVPENEILIDDTSLNTEQNAHNVRGILMEKGFKKPILVTSAFHMERSVLNFAKEGIAVIPYPSDYLVSIGGNSIYVNNLVPSAEGLRYSYIALHEYLGIVAVKLR